MRVQHRHIIYIQGYDPRGLAQYYRMFRTELRKFARLYGISATTTRPQAADNGEIASWAIETEAADWRTRGRPHPVYVYGGAVVLLQQLLTVPFAATDAWMNLARAFERLAG